MSEEFVVDKHWVCPDVQNITLNNDGFVYITSDSTNFVMVVNDCDVA